MPNTAKLATLICLFLAPCTANAEVADVIFLMDPSGSVGGSLQALQKNGIKNCIADFPLNGDVAVAVLTFNATSVPSTRNEVPLTAVDDAGAVATIHGLIDGLSGGGSSSPATALARAETIFNTLAAPGSQRFIIMSTDARATPAFQEAQQLRQAGVRICTVGIGGGCTLGTSIDILNQYANTVDTGPLYPSQPVGLYTCADETADFEPLCDECVQWYRDILRIDANNDGLVDLSGNPEACDDPNADDCIENEPGLNKGLLLAVNNNDSDGDGVEDDYDVIINGANDEQDLREVYVRAPQGATDGTVRLTVEPASAAGRFRLFGPSGLFVLGASALDAEGEPTGPNVTEVEIPVSALADWAGFKIEGVDRGVVRIKATWIAAGGEETSSNDTVKIVVFRVLTGLADEPEDPGVPGTLSADDASVEYTALVDFLDESGNIVLAQNGTVVQWQVVSGSAVLSETSSTTSGGIAGTTVTANTFAGSSFQLSARLSEVKIAGSTVNLTSPLQYTPEVITVPGEPWTVTVQPDTQLSYPASEVNWLRFSVTAVDQFANPVPDGTPMAVDFTGGARLDLGYTSPFFSGGTAQVGVIAGVGTEPEQQLKVFVGQQEAEQVISQVPLIITLFPSETRIPICWDEYIDIGATVESADGSTVEDGTVIVWLTSLGSLSADGLSRTGPMAVTTVVGEQTAIRLFTMPTDMQGLSLPELERAGFPWVIASSGLSHAKDQIEFFDPNLEPPEGPESSGGTPVQLALDQLVLAGDATEDGTEVIDDLSDFETLVNVRNHLGLWASASPESDLDGDGQITLVDLIQASQLPPPPPVTAPYYAQTQATVTGDPGDVVQITASSYDGLELIGLAPDSTLTLDAAGQGNFLVRSLGTLGDSVEFVVLSTRRLGGGEATASTSPCPDKPSDKPLVLVPKVQHSFWYNLLAGAVWGGGDGAEAFVADTAVSIFAVGDIRDIIVETLKIAPGGEDPSGLTVAMAGVGLGTTFFPPGDASVAVIKNVLKKVNKLVPNSGLTKLVKKIVVEAFTALKQGGHGAFLQVFDSSKAFFSAIIKNDDFVRLCARFDETVLDSTRRLLTEFGESFAGRLTYAATKTSMTAAKKAIRVIDSLDEATLALIKAKPQAAQDAIVRGLAECQGRRVAGRWIGQVDDDVLKTFLSPEYLDIITDPDVVGMEIEEFVTMVGAVARNEAGSQGTKHMNEFVTRFRDWTELYRQNPVEGNLWDVKAKVNELREAYGIVTHAPDLKLTSLGRNPKLSNVEDLDGVAERVSDGKKVLFEFKRGQNAAHPKTKGKRKFIRQIKNRIELVKLRVPINDFTGAEIHVWLNDSVADWSPSLKQELIELGNASGVTLVLERSPFPWGASPPQP